jgi:hypothetical protein
MLAYKMYRRRGYSPAEADRLAGKGPPKRKKKKRKGSRYITESELRAYGKMSAKAKAKKKARHPVSEKQRRWAFVAEERGELPKGKALEWSRRVKGQSLKSLSTGDPNALRDVMQKARRGQAIGGAYVKRTWNPKKNKGKGGWDYDYKHEGKKHAKKREKEKQLGLFEQQAKEEPKKYRAVHAAGGYGTGSASKFAVEVYDPRPGKTPWRTVSMHGSYKAATAEAAKLRGKPKETPEPELPKPGQAMGEARPPSRLLQCAQGARTARAVRQALVRLGPRRVAEPRSGEAGAQGRRHRGRHAGVSGAWRSADDARGRAQATRAAAVADRGRGRSRRARAGGWLRADAGS